MAEVMDVAVDFGQMRRREWRRIFALSLVGHAALLFALTWTPGYDVVSLPGVVTVELVAAPASAPRAKAPPRPPVAKKVVLPRQPTTPKPKPQEVVEKVAPPPEPVPQPEERSYTDVLAQLRADAGEDAAEPEATPPQAPAAAGSAGRGPLASPEVIAWVRQAKIHVRKAWVLPPAFRTQALEAHLLVNLDAAGNVIGEPKVVRRSGNPWYDEGVVRAIEKASPLPPPPAADEWAFVFVPGDSY